MYLGKNPRRQGDVAEEGQWRRVVELRLQFIIALNLITGMQYLVGLSSLLAEERIKLFSAGCLTIYLWRRSSPRKTSTQSLMRTALLPSGGCLKMATVFKHMKHWACPKRSMKKYFSFLVGLKARCSMSTFFFLTDEVADMIFYLFKYIYTR